MATTPEGRVKALVRKLLDSHSAYYHMPVQNGMGKPSLDFIVCHSARFAAIETKAPGKKPTLRQEGTIREIRGAKGAVFVIDSDECEGMRDLKFWLALGGS